MKYSLLPAVAFVASSFAQNLPTDAAYEAQEIKFLMNDVTAHLTDYESFGVNHGMNLPSGLIDFAMSMMTYTDDSYTTLISMVDMVAVDQMVTELPWYSSRLQPGLEALISSPTETASAATSSAATSTASSAQTTSTLTSSVTNASSSTSSRVLSSSASSVQSSSIASSASTSSTSSAKNGADGAKLSSAALAIALFASLLF